MLLAVVLNWVNLVGNMRTFILFLLGLLGSMGALSHAVEAPVGVTVKVMTFNIRYDTKDDGEDRWDKRKEFVMDVMRQEAPDVVGLQEAMPRQLEEIRKGFPEFGIVGGAINGENRAILYKSARFDVAASGTFWLSDTPEKPSKSWGNRVLRTCTWARFVDKASGRTFFIYNTHLDHESQPAREKGARLILETMRGRTPADPIVLTGDFNAAEDNPAVKYLKGTDGASVREVPKLVDTFRVLHPDAEEVGTFNAFKGRTYGAKIDYIFVEPTTRTVDAAIVRTQRNGRWPSDHFPVTATVSL